MRILPTLQFAKDLKRLRKKYPSINQDLRNLQEKLLEDPHLGESLGDNRYKVRLKISSKGKGKSGGGRVITYLKLHNEQLWLLTMYDKSEIESVNDDFLDDLVKAINRDGEI
jgi:mRNA-degrading endonuclease RelE of RelBE toxin-antitoxin system